MSRRESNDPPPDVKQAMLCAYAGVFSFNTNPPFHMGRADKARGFWLRDAAGAVTEVAGKAWADKFPPRSKPLGKRAYQEANMPHVGGRIVIGLSKVSDQPADVARIEAYVPSLITDVLGEELVESGWTVGSFGYGRYVAKDGTVFNERSTVVQIAGIDGEKLKEIGALLAEHLNQSCVLVFDDNAGTASMISPD